MLDAWPIEFRKGIYEDKSRGFTRITYGRTFHLTTPVAPLLKTLASSVGQIIPEKQAELAAIIKKDIGIRIDAVSQDFYIAAHVEQRYVNVGLAALERIWAYTYFYLAILDLFQKNGPGVLINLLNNHEIQPARSLAIWALTCEKNKSQTPWPEDLPRPDKDDGSDDHIGKTNSYFYNALCFIVLHEIGHIVSEHSTSKFMDRESSYKCEYQADEWAATFMLEGWEKASRGEKDFIGRCTGIALGLSILAGVELYHHEAKDDHPTIAERLLKFFDKFCRESAGPIAEMREFPMYFATIIIHGHFMNAGIPFDFRKKYEDFTDYLIAAHRAMAEHKG
jgi:hypothetical protein